MLMLCLSTCWDRMLPEGLVGRVGNRERGKGRETGRSTGVGWGRERGRNPCQGRAEEREGNENQSSSLHIHNLSLLHPPLQSSAKVHGDLRKNKAASRTPAPQRLTKHPLTPCPPPTAHNEPEISQSLQMQNLHLTRNVL